MVYSMHSRLAGMTIQGSYTGLLGADKHKPKLIQHSGPLPWISRPSFQTWIYHPALAGTPPEEGNWNHFGGLFPTRLYHGSAELAERPASP